MTALKARWKAVSAFGVTFLGTLITANQGVDPSTMDGSDWGYALVVAAVAAVAVERTKNKPAV
jgi:hypothetical protein